MNLRVLGTFSRSHGLKGAFKVNIAVDECPPLIENEPVFIQLQGGPVPFFVEECRGNAARSIILKLEDIDSIEATSKFIGKELLLPSDMFAEPEEDEKEKLIDFDVYDINHGNLGKVLGVMYLPQHPVLEVENNGKQILIPFVDSVVVEIDESNRKLTVETPDGLVDLYLNG